MLNSNAYLILWEKQMTNLQTFRQVANWMR